MHRQTAEDDPNTNFAKVRPGINVRTKFSKSYQTTQKVPPEMEALAKKSET